MGRPALVVRTRVEITQIFGVRIDRIRNVVSSHFTSRARSLRIEQHAVGRGGYRPIRVGYDLVAYWTPGSLAESWAGGSRGRSASWI